MICKVCGMDSKTPETCSWCGAAMTAGAATPAPKAAPRSAPQEPEAVEAPEAQVTAEVEDPSVGNPFSLTAPKPPAATAAPLTGDPRRDSGPEQNRQQKPDMSMSPRKIAPGMPPPGSKQRAPAPAMPMNRSVAPLSDMVSPARPPVQDLLNAPAPTTPAPSQPAVQSLMEQAESLMTPPTVETAAPAAHLPQPSSPIPAPPEMTIGSGVTPPRSTPSPVNPALPPVVVARQKRAAVEAALADSEPDLKAMLGQYLGVFALILIVMSVIAHFAPKFYVVPMVIAMFVAALLLPVMRLTPWVEEDAEDLGWFILLTLVFGPLVALVIYGVVAAFRQSFNSSILGCLATVAVLRIAAELASGGVGSAGHLFSLTSPFTSIRSIDSGIFKLLLLNWSGFAALAGWYTASSFHKEDE